MRFRSQIVLTLFFQSIGAIAGFLSIALLGIYLGPTEQGMFSLVKIEVTFVGSVAVLGITQALFYYVQSSQMGIDRAKSIAAIVALISGIFAFSYGILLQKLMGFDLIAFVLACMSYVLSSILRGIILAATTTLLFNMMTIIPQGLLLLYVGIVVLIGDINKLDISVAFAVSFGISVVLGIHWLTLASKPASLITEIGLSNVLRYGLASGVAEVAATVSLLLVVKAVGSQLGAIELGIFTLATTLIQGLLLPISYTAPLLFRHWIERPDVLDSMKAAIVIFTILGTLAFIVRYILDDIVSSDWLGEYASMKNFLWIMFLAAAFDGCQKIMAVKNNSQGVPWLTALSEVLRLAIVVGGLALWHIQQMYDLAWISCLAAMAASIMLFTFHIHRRQIKFRV